MPAECKVLLIEDSTFHRKASERALSKAGYTVSVAVDGEQALQMVEQALPDIILLDMLLPKISGPDVLKSLKANPATLDIPVIVLTGLSQRNEEKLLRAGAAAYYEKSILALDKNSDRLAVAIEKALQQWHEQHKRRHAPPASVPQPETGADLSCSGWENAIVGVESEACTTTTQRSRSKN